VVAQRHPLDEQLGWPESDYFTVTLEATCRLSELLHHLYVLVPVLDDEKHYWVSADEVEKLMRRGEDWLADHPEQKLIVRRYLKHQRRLTDQALDRLVTPDEDSPDSDLLEDPQAALEEGLGLHEQRLGAVVAVLKSCGAQRVLDLGCGGGRLLERLLQEGFEDIVGLDVSSRALERARARLGWDRLPARQRERIRLMHGSLVYRDRRLPGYDAATVIEVIEHLDPWRLAAFERVLFECAGLPTVVITTPNAEYNVKFEGLSPGEFRHRDHRFEWTRAQFQAWAKGVAERYGYAVRFLAVGPEDPAVGPPTQMGVFTREDHGS
jgi:3' terminal RNA ribose 2'-O-methyltransferase Hen1